MASLPTTPAPGSTTTTRSNTPTLSMPDTNEVPEQSAPDTSSKIKILLGVLKKFLNVSDLANVRAQIPISLLSPVPNLEYWIAVERPDVFVSLGKSEEPLGRMMECLRYWHTKDLRFIHGKPIKPYNSTLGEVFRCNWDIATDSPPFDSVSKAPPQPSRDPLQPDSQEPIRVSYLTEQTSHHPPVSAFWAECPARGIVARGYDQISAKFSGTYVKVVAGTHNKGMFITLKQRDNEEYHMTHPDSQLNGLLKASPYISVADVCYITCEKTRLKVILHYVEEGYFGRAQNKVIGVVYRYDPETDRYTRPRDVPEKDVLVRIDGDWKDKIYYTVPATEAVKNEPNVEPTKERQLLADVSPLRPVPKIVPPPEQQISNESRKQWADVTNSIIEKRLNEASAFKHEIEQRQRDKAAVREKEGKKFIPRFFQDATNESGKPELTDEGRKVLANMQQLNFQLDERLEDSA